MCCSHKQRPIFLPERYHSHISTNQCQSLEKTLKCWAIFFIQFFCPIWHLLRSYRLNDHTERSFARKNSIRIIATILLQLPQYTITADDEQPHGSKCYIWWEHAINILSTFGAMVYQLPTLTALCRLLDGISIITAESRRWWMEKKAWFRAWDAVQWSDLRLGNVYIEKQSKAAELIVNSSDRSSLSDLIHAHTGKPVLNSHTASYW